MRIEKKKKKEKELRIGVLYLYMGYLLGLVIWFYLIRGGWGSIVLCLGSGELDFFGEW